MWKRGHLNYRLDILKRELSSEMQGLFVALLRLALSSCEDKMHENTSRDELMITSLAMSVCFR
eukprot:335320-Amphidinium_carterae.2